MADKKNHTDEKENSHCFIVVQFYSCIIVEHTIKSFKAAFSKMRVFFPLSNKWKQVRKSFQIKKQGKKKDLMSL